MSYRINMKATKKLKISTILRQTTILKNSLKVKPNYNRILNEGYV